ncbi:hypothetical protein D9M72_181580 [compost metagenome]
MNNAMTTIRFNFNDRVRIRLTPHGRAFHAMQHVMFNMQNGTDLKYVPPVEDAEGWSEWHMHEIANQFGEQLYNGNAELPFETTAELIIDKE